MIVAFLESIRYVGHLFPVAFLRFFLGYYYFTTSVENFNGDFTTHPRLADLVKHGVASGALPEWYERFLQTVVMPHWMAAAYIVITLEFLIGISFLVGFVVRPAAIIGAIISFHFAVMTKGNEATLYTGLTALHVMFAWLGAGRCLGLDYFFYKRQRGIWW